MDREDPDVEDTQTLKGGKKKMNVKDIIKRKASQVRVVPVLT